MFWLLEKTLNIFDFPVCFLEVTLCRQTSMKSVSEIFILSFSRNLSSFLAFLFSRTPYESPM